MIPAASSRFACDMSALSPAQRAQHVRLARSVFGAVGSIESAPDAYRFILAADVGLLPVLAEFITLERLCCPFFDFTVEVPSGDGSLVLQVGGPAGVQPFVRAEFSALLPGRARFPDARDGAAG